MSALFSVLQSASRRKEVLYVDQVDLEIEQLAALFNRATMSLGTPSRGISEYRLLLLNFLVAELEGLNWLDAAVVAEVDRIHS